MLVLLRRAFNNRFPSSVLRTKFIRGMSFQALEASKHAADSTTQESLDFSEFWKAFGRTGEMPPLVRKLMHEIRGLEFELGEKLVFSGPRGSLQGRAKAAEEHRYRTFLGRTADGEEKLQFYSARQVACRIMGNKGYLCERCWLPLMEDCICENIKPMALPPNIRFWIYMHPKDYLRKNNSGKLLWQVFGSTSSKLCVFGIQEQEDAMWESLEKAGQKVVWYLYPEQSPADYHVEEIEIPQDVTCDYTSKVTCLAQEIEIPGDVTCDYTSKESCKSVLNFILIDGTWCNSKAMVNRLQSRARKTWPDQYMRSLVLSPEKLSVLHNLRPQPSLDRTCTAGAAAQLLHELNLRKELSGFRLSEAANALEYSLEYLLDALTKRRERVGRPVIPKKTTIMH